MAVSQQTDAQTDTPTDMQRLWRDLDAQIRGWWDSDVRTAHEPDVRSDPDGTLLYLPHPYLTPGGSGSAFPEMYGWDTYFINLGLLAHGRSWSVRQHIRNQLFMISRYGKVLNGNRSYYLSRSQTPLLAESLFRLCEQHFDPGLVMQAYPLLKLEFETYWSDEGHTTPTGLTTAYDSGDPHHRPELAAEAETGLDFCAIYGGDVRRCVPLILNCALSRTLTVLAWAAQRLHLEEDAAHWRDEEAARRERIRTLCWDEEAGFFLEYDFVSGERLPYRSLCAYWTLWAGVASAAQAERLVARLPDFEARYGLAFTDRVYPSPHPEFSALQWQHPAGWPPLHLIVVDGLMRYGYRAEARRVAQTFLAGMLTTYAATGQLWEKYNVLTGSPELPLERYPTPPLHGWSSAAAVILGRVLYPEGADVHA